MPAQLARQLLLTCTLFVPLPASAGFITLGDLAGGTFSSRATAITPDGNYVIGYSSVSSRGDHAFRWAATTGMVDLGEIPGFGSLGQNIKARAVSADGSIIVGESSAGTIPGTQAFRWTESDGMVGLGDLVETTAGPFSRMRSFAYTISGDGSLIAGDSRHPVSGSTTPMQYTRADGMTGIELSVSNPANGANTVYGSTFDGSVLVGSINSVTSGKLNEAFRWTATGGIERLGFVDTGNISQAHAVTPDGAVIVGTARDPLQLHAFRWTDADGFDLLNDGTVFQASGALAVSASGTTIVGTAHTFVSGGPNAMIWDNQNGMQLLSDVLAMQGDDLMGYTLIDATGISADGRTITGTAIRPGGGFEAYVAVLTHQSTSVPEPCGTVIWLAAMAHLGFVRRRPSATHRR
ncbi:MAG: hypothetical protein KDB00_19225 [Planctomycetales bacterium]|nr:hypothetical protein [Planctomycetales bacterium]